MSAQQPDSLIDQLKRMPAEDLRALLSDVFPLVRFEEGRTIDYLNREGLALSLTYSAQGRVRELTPGQAFSAEDRTRTEEALRDRTGAQHDNFMSHFMFSDRPVRGWWRYRDKFQILPPPADAPIPNELLGQWPFLLELRFRSPSSGNAIISARMREGNRIRLLLPVLIRGVKFAPTFYTPQKYWVIPMQSEPSLQQLPIYAQEYYDIPGRRIGGPELADMPPEEAAKVVPAEDYYELKGRTGDEVVEIASTLESLFDAYYALPPERRVTYLRACYWFNLGRFLFPYSASMSFVALVMAIESLLPEERPHICNVCEKDHHPSITGAFRRFLNQYVPDTPEREEFYATRSSIAHGSALLSFDVREEWGTEGFHPAAIRERQRQDDLWQVTQLALVNWLASATTD
jgi:hypothetical protein